MTTHYNDTLDRREAKERHEAEMRRLDEKELEQRLNTMTEAELRAVMAKYPKWHYIYIEAEEILRVSENENM